MAISRSVIQTVLRVAQIIFCILCLASSAYWINFLRTTWIGLLTLAAPLNFVLFSSLLGLLVSGTLLIGPLCNRQLAGRLPGLVDLILSGLLTIFFLSSGGALAAYGGCTGTYNSADSSHYGASAYDSKYWEKQINDMTNQLTNSYGGSSGRRLLAVDTVAASGSRRALLSVEPLCATWDLMIAMSFLCFVLYGVSTVLAGLDLKEGKGWWNPKGAASMSAAPPHDDNKVSPGTIAIPIKTPMVPAPTAAKYTVDNTGSAAEVDMLPR